MKNYTIKDIAQLAGVSKGTVDRVLHKRGKVSEIALKKVTEILKEIDYKPNPIAKSLKNNKIYNICVLLPDALLDPYWNPCNIAIQEIENEFKNFGIQIKKFVFDPSNTDSFTESAMVVIDTSPDAILMVPLFQNEAKEIMKFCEEKNIKTSTFNNRIDTDIATNFIGQNLFQSGRVAANLLDILLKKGHICILHIDEDYHNATHLQEKEKGFRSFIENKNYTISTINLAYKNSENFTKTIQEVLDKNLDINGFFITTSKSYGVVNALKEKIDRIAIVGYDLMEKNINFLTQGYIDFLINQNPKQQVYTGLHYLVEHFLFDKEIPAEVLLPINIVNSENIDGYLN